MEGTGSMARKTTRRQLLATGALPVAGVAVAHSLGIVNIEARQAFAAQEATPSAQEVGTAQAPAWSFTVTQYHDPWGGAVSRPETPPAGTRYIGAEVVIRNDSEDPMEYTTRDIFLRSIDGVQYPAGEVTSDDVPALVNQNLPDQERARGWVWFAVRQEDEITSVQFVGPSPVFRVRLPEPGA
jgi:hypothetical protein